LQSADLNAFINYAASLDSLQHIVVLMREHRSFDHMLDFAQTPQWPIDGLGSETTP